MENKLKRLFDYQAFEKNPKLEKLIRETESHYAEELSDEDLAMATAAGEITGEDIGSKPDSSNEWHGVENEPGIFEKGSRFWVK